MIFLTPNGKNMEKKKTVKPPKAYLIGSTLGEWFEAVEARSVPEAAIQIISLQQPFDSGDSAYDVLVWEFQDLSLIGKFVYDSSPSTIPPGYDINSLAKDGCSPWSFCVRVRKEIQDKGNVILTIWTD